MTSRKIYLVSLTPPTEADVIHLPLLRTHWHNPSLDLARHDSIVVTSKSGVDALERIDPAWKQLHLLCVGSATSRRAQQVGAVVAATADGYGDTLFEMIMAQGRGRHWLYARPKVVASDFAQRLRDEGIAMDEAVVYETRCVQPPEPVTLAKNGVLIFTSPSALHCFEKYFELCDTHTLVAIGTTTHKALGNRETHLAAEPSVSACITLAKALAKETK